LTVFFGLAGHPDSRVAFSYLELGRRQAMCWCDETHTRGSMHNGEVKHYVANWKLYQIRHKEPKKVKRPAPALDVLEILGRPEPVAVG